ncbi:MAG: glycosyltransferase family 39 protein, partial [bacterium]|nr:glycosyltransferase family 39 protein [bacterium]
SYFAGDSLLSLRLLSILFGVLTVWAGYLFVKQAFGNKKLALLASLLLAINPFQIQYALEARMYTLGTFLVLWSSYLLQKALDNSVQDGRKNIKYWLGYSVIVAAGLYTHYYVLFSIAAQGLYIIFYFVRSKKFNILFKSALAYGLSVLLYLPWVPTLLAQIKRVEESYWIPAMDRWSVPGTVWKMMFGGQGIGRIYLAVASAISLFLIIYFIRRVRSFAKWYVLLGLLVPISAAIAVSLRTNLYLDRYFVFASLFFSILVVITFLKISNRAVRWFLILALIAGSLFAFFKNWSDLGIKNKPGMAAASAYINQNAKFGNKIYVGSSFIFFTFKYYNGTGITPLLISSEPIESIPHFSGTAILTNDDLILDISRAQKNSTVWLLWTTGFGGSKPQVPADWRQISETSFEDAPGFKGWIVTTKYLVN